MSRQPPDPFETNNLAGGLFDPNPNRLHRQDDPATSRAAARAAVEDGTAKDDATYLVSLILLRPGCTMAEYGAVAAAERGGDGFRWRLKLGRRTGELKDAGLIHVAGERNGLSLWWPGGSNGQP